RDAQSALGVLVFLLQFSFQFFGILDEMLNPRLFLTALFGSQRFTVVGDHQAGSSLLGLDIKSCGGSVGGGLRAPKQEVGGVVIGRLNFVLHRFAHQVH